MVQIERYTWSMIQHMDYGPWSNVLCLNYGTSLEWCPHDHIIAEIMNIFECVNTLYWFLRFENLHDPDNTIQLEPYFYTMLTQEFWKDPNSTAASVSFGIIEADHRQSNTTRNWMQKKNSSPIHIKKIKL